ncbi:MAG: hypothetical protein H7245_18015, partial [Candidatus Saccharibacteria bacterium]|nr:hypothetical protein [Pseudorhodobacter sp.]
MSTFRQNLTRARSHIVVILALICGLLLALHLEDIDAASASPRDDKSMARFADAVPQTLATPLKLDAQQLDHARTAWQF